MAVTLSVCIGLSLICWRAAGRVKADHLEEVVIESECRDRYLWVHVASTGQLPQFEAVDGSGIHPISDQLGSRCGYTISTFRMDGYTTFRASYYSCYTENQNDEVFSFNLNIIVTNAEGQWSSNPLSKACSPAMPLSQREVICEEDYMEVSVNRDDTCESHQGNTRLAWQDAFSLAQRTATSAWQLMFMKNGDQVAPMAITVAQRLGYSLTATVNRVVFRSPYRQPQSEVVMVDGVPVEVIQGSLFFKQKLMVVMIDISMACTVNSGSFDGVRLLWDIPRVMTPLVGEGVGFESQSIGLGVEGQLLDQPTANARGFTLVLHGALVQIGVPFGAEGGYRRSLVVNNVYRETYVIFLLYQHVFSLLYEDGSSLETRHRLLRVVDTPLRCHRPFTIDQTISEDHVFSVYLGNIPSDVALEEVKINGERLSMEEAAEHGYSISNVAHINSSQAFTLRVPFGDWVVHRTYLGEGVLQYSLDINYTLTIMPQRDSYYHHTFITAQIHNAFPPELSAECTDGGITFSMLKQPRVENLWEVGVGQEPLTAELAAQRGYLLQNESQSITLEVPVFSIGYTYEDINLHDFYGTFKLLLRDSKTLEVQTSTSERCLFKTEEMIVCSADGTMTVVTTQTMTWPKVLPDRTSLLDRTCGPKQTDQSKVLFEFSLDSCGTRVMVDESYVVYENEILHDRQLIADGPAFISRDSQFKLTVRCFYPLSAVNTLFVDNIFRSEMPGFGSIKVLKSTKDAAIKLPTHECPLQVSANTVGAPLLVHQNPAANGVQPYPSRPWPGPSHFVTVLGGNHKLLTGSHDSVLGSRNQPFPIINHSAPEHQTMSSQTSSPYVPAPSGHYLSQTEDQHNLGSPSENSFLSFHPRYSDSQDGNVQPSHINTPSLGFVQVGGGDPAISFYATNKNPNSPVDHLQSNWESAGQGETFQAQDSLGQTDTDLKWHESTLSQNGIVKSNKEQQSLSKVKLSLGIHGPNRGHEARPALSHHGSSVGRMELVHSGLWLNPGSFNTDKRTDSQLPSHDLTGSHPYDPVQMGNMPISQLNPAHENPFHYGPYHISSGKPYDGAVSSVRVSSRDKKYVPIKYTTSRNGNVETVPDSPGDTQGSGTFQKNLQVAAQFPNIHVNPPQHIGIKPTSNKSTPQRSRVDHSPLRTDHFEQNNVQPVQYSVQNRGPQSIRVKSPSVLTLKDSSDENLPTSQQVPEHDGSNSRGDYVPLFQQLIQPAKKQERGAHSVRVTPDVTTSDPSQYGHWPGLTQQKLLQSLTERRNGGGQQSAASSKNVIQLAVAPHIRVKPAPSQQASPGSSGRHQVPDQLKYQSTQKGTSHFNSVTREGNGKPIIIASYPSASHYEKPQGSKVAHNSKGHVGKGALNTKIPSLPSQLNNMLGTRHHGAVQRGIAGPQSQGNTHQRVINHYGASHSHAVEPSPQVSIIKPDSSQNRGTVTVRVKPDPFPGNPSQQPFNQYRDPMSSEFNPAPLQSIIQPATGDQDVAGPVSNLFDFPLKSREPPSYNHTPQRIRVRPGNDILQVQNLFGNSKQENVQPSTDGSTAAKLDPHQAHGLVAQQISDHHTVSKGRVQPNSGTDVSTTGLVSDSFQKPSNFYQQLSQHGQPDKHQTTSTDHNHMPYNVLSTIRKDQVEIAESNPYEKYSNHGSPTNFLKVSGSPAHSVGSLGRVGQTSPRSGQGGHDQMNSAAQLALHLDDFQSSARPSNIINSPSQANHNVMETQPQKANDSNHPSPNLGSAQTVSYNSGYSSSQADYLREYNPTNPKDLNNERRGMFHGAQTTSDCSRPGGSAPFLPVSSGGTGHYGTSVHQGIIRGKRNP